MAQPAIQQSRPSAVPEGAPRRYDGLDQMLIGARWRAGRSGKRRADTDPYTGETLAEFALADAKDVDEAYRAAREAQPSWAAALPHERRDVLERAARIMVRRREEIVDWLIREAGRTRIKANIEWQLVHEGMLEAATYPAHVEGRILPADVPGKESRVYRHPVGVVGVISPWNFPLQLTNRSVAPALAVGNAVVVKPASDTPVTGGILLAKIYEEAGLPAGLLGVVVGAAGDIGDAFVEHPIPRVVSFTGSTPVGRHIAEIAGRSLKRVCLELGGNGPFVVLDDADLDEAVHSALVGKFLHQGQICMAVNRILVDRTRHDEFVERFVEAVRKLPVGDPSDERTVIGPIINRSQLASLEHKIDASIEQGACAVVRGEVRGQVLPPVVLVDVTNDMPAAREELFGPVAPILSFDGDEDGLRLANDTEYGLSSAIWTSDVARGVRLAKRLEAGMTHVNDSPVEDQPNTAFGGEKSSGLGRFGGAWAVEEFTSDHWISVQDRPRPLPF